MTAPGDVTAAVHAGAAGRTWTGALVERPHLTLGLVGATALVCEFAARESGSSAFVGFAALVAGLGFLAVWRGQDGLRLLPLLVVTAAFHIAWIGLHLSLDVSSFDSEELYRAWGNELLDGRYPEAQYPPGAVLLFALDAWLGGGETRTSHALVMVPFQLATVGLVWLLRAPLTPWLAALVAMWPLNAFFWEFRFELVPAAFLAGGLLLAYRGRWLSSGLVLGIGAAVKWTPAISFALLLVWLLASRRTGIAARHALGFVAAFALLHLPFLAWRPNETLYAYRYFGDQGLTGESIWYLVLFPLGRASVDEAAFWLPAEVPGWADPTATIVQAALLVLLAGAAVHVRRAAPPAIAIAALGPVVFLLANRIFSPQYLVLVLVAWAVAGSLVLRSRREQLVVGVAAMVAATANAFVYPYTLYGLDLWKLASLVLFATSFSTTGWLVWRAIASTTRVAPP